MLCEAARAIRVLMPHVPLIVNGRFDVALAMGASGVHLGSDDLAPELVRRVVPDEFLIGASVGSEHDAARAVHADYVGIGSLFGGNVDAGPLGVAGFAALAARCAKPAVAIGGIDLLNVASVMRAGASGVAVISALFGSRDPAAAARAMRVAQDATGT